MRLLVPRLGLPLTEKAYLDLGETPDRIELFDGDLYLSARGQPRRQFMVGRLMAALRAGAADADLHLFGAVNVRLRRHRIAIPDLVLTQPIDESDPVVPARSVVLVAEVATRHDAVNRVLKHHFYAAAGIAWYLLVEPGRATLQLYRLSGGRYAEHSVTRPGEVLRLVEPLNADLVPEDLLPPE